MIQTLAGMYTLSETECNCCNTMCLCNEILVVNIIDKNNFVHLTRGCREQKGTARSCTQSRNYPPS